MKNYKSVLKGLENSVPPSAYGYTVSMYSIALEGWRRGLTLKFLNKNRSKAHTVYNLSDGKNTHTFSVSRGDAVARDAIKICVNKHLTKEYLSKHRVPVPKGNIFNGSNTEEEMIDYATELGYPVVLKPTDGTGGHGVIANIKDGTELKSALHYVKNVLNYSNLIIEQYFEGEDYRLYVIDNQVIGAFKKIPANIIGDGVLTIKELLRLKNVERTQTPALRNRPIKTDTETENLLKSKGYTMESIPKKGEQVFLKTKNNVSAGGDPIDVTDLLTDELKEIAINASKAIPTLVQCGVDMMVNIENNTGVVLEVNSRPHITAHLYPMQGEARDIPKAIIDYYFPETNQNLKSPLYYFDFKTVVDAFDSGICKEYVIPNVPDSDLTSARFRLSGIWGNDFYKKWVQKNAIKLSLNGYIKHLQNGETSIVISGPANSIDKFRKLINDDASKRKKVIKIVEKSWNKPIPIGFEIKENGMRNEKKTTKQSVVKKSKGTQRINSNYNYKALKVERDYYKKKYFDMRDSKSWKVMKPFRMVRKMIKDKNNEN